MKSKLKKPLEVAKMSVAAYTIKLRTDLATLAALPEEETPTPFVLHTGHDFNGEESVLFLAGFSNDWKKRIKAEKWLVAPEAKHVWLGTCVLKGEEMQLTIKKGKLTSTLFHTAIRKNAALKRLEWDLTEDIDENDDDDALLADDDQEDKVPETKLSKEAQDALKEQKQKHEQKAHAIQKQLVEWMTKLKEANPEQKKKLLEAIDKLADQLYVIPDWEDYTDDKVEQYLQQIERFIAEHNHAEEEEKAKIPMAQRLNQLHRALEKGVNAFQEAKEQADKIKIIKWMTGIGIEWESLSQQAEEKDFTPEQRKEMPIIKQFIKKINPKAPLSLTLTPVKEIPAKDIKVTVKLHALPALSVSVKDTDTVQTLLNAVAAQNVQLIQSLDLGGHDVMNRRGDTLRAIGINTDTILTWGADNGWNNTTTWESALWAFDQGTQQTAFMSHLIERHNLDNTALAFWRLFANAPQAFGEVKARFVGQRSALIEVLKTVSMQELNNKVSLIEASLLCQKTESLAVLKDAGTEQLKAWNGLTDKTLQTGMENLKPEAFQKVLAALEQVPALEKSYGLLTDKANLEKLLSLDKALVEVFNTVQDKELIKTMEGLEADEIKRYLTALQQTPELADSFGKLKDKKNFEKLLKLDKTAIETYNKLTADGITEHLEGLEETKVKEQLEALAKVPELEASFKLLKDKKNFEKLLKLDKTAIETYNKLTADGITEHLEGLEETKVKEQLEALAKVPELEASFKLLKDKKNFEKLLKLDKTAIEAYNKLTADGITEHLEKLEEDKVKTHLEALAKVPELEASFKLLKDKKNFEKLLKLDKTAIEAYNKLTTDGITEHLEKLEEDKVKTHLEALAKVPELEASFKLLKDKKNFEKFLKLDKDQAEVFNTKITDFNKLKVTKAKDLLEHIEKLDTDTKVTEIVSKIKGTPELVNIWELFAATNVTTAKGIYDKFLDLDSAEAKNYLLLITGKDDGTVFTTATNRSNIKQAFTTNTKMQRAEVKQFTKDYTATSSFGNTAIKNALDYMNGGSVNTYLDYWKEFSTTTLSDPKLRSDKYFLEAVDKARSSNLWHHIEGDVNSSNNAGGGHYINPSTISYSDPYVTSGNLSFHKNWVIDPNPYNPTPPPPPIPRQIAGNGVDIWKNGHWYTKSAQTTVFPSTWTPDDIQKQIALAHRKAREGEGTQMGFNRYDVSATKDGVTIAVCCNNNNFNSYIKTVFPV